jgi:hypothetical protein
LRFATRHERRSDDVQTCLPQENQGPRVPELPSPENKNLKVKRIMFAITLIFLAETSGGFNRKKQYG